MGWGHSQDMSWLIKNPAPCTRGYPTWHRHTKAGAVQLPLKFSLLAQRQPSRHTQRLFHTGWSCSGDGAFPPAEPAKIMEKGKREGGKSNQRQCFELNKTLNCMENSIRLIRYLP